MTPAK